MGVNILQFSLGRASEVLNIRPARSLGREHIVSELPDSWVQLALAPYSQAAKEAGTERPWIHTHIIAGVLLLRRCGAAAAD